MTTDYQPSGVEVRESTGWVIALSIGLIILGILAIVLPGFASVFFVSVMGWVALISGVLQVIQAFKARAVKGFWLNLVVGILYVAAGLYILFNPVKATAVLTLAFGFLFIAEGIFTIIMAFTNRAGRSMSWLVVLNGVITLILGILVLNQWPFSTIWLIGLYVGISLLMSGFSLLMAALAARREVA
ncbi:MAG: HdeD family acid-resistance protein [Leptolyngbyaceae cyanobacterium SM2_3_12]|nr:HdeD family acid-resistance protein [Leptolyngbyaceae cyanobacterium SM2_3_12]